MREIRCQPYAHPSTLVLIQNCVLLLQAAARAEAHKQARLEYEAHVAASDHVAYFSAAVPSASSTVGAHRASGNKRKAGVTLESRNVASAAGSSSGRSGTDFEAPEPEPLLRPQQPPRVSASSAFDFAGPVSRDPDSSSSNSGPPSGQGRKTPRRAAAQAGVLAAGTGAGGATSSASAVPTWLPSQAPRQMSATWGLALPSYELTRRYFAARQAGLGATEAAAACLCSSDLEPTLSPNAAAPAVASQVNSSEQASCAGTRADGAASDGASSRVASTGVSVTPAMVSFVVVESAPTPILHHPHEVTTASVRCEETASENFQSAPNDIDGSKIESISGDLVGIASTRPVAGSHDSDMMAESAPEFRGPEGVSNCGVANETTSSNSASSDALSSAS